MTLLSDNGISRVWRDGDWVYKCQPKFLTDNEWYALQLLADTGLVPHAEKVSHDTIRMRFINSEPVTDPVAFERRCNSVLGILRTRKIRHGDLTKYAILVRDNAPVLIDWAESRHWDDPRPDKRREGDAYWLKKTVRELCER